uniref:NEDD8-activating enzyme E1 catalytic subunit n=1 Tax=Romanomermis culicivorax TaxID=13658 RepID=A0A915KI89_ROMCU
MNETTVKETAYLPKILLRGGPLAHPDFSPGEENLESLAKCKVLVIGAGGLGCELLKNLAMMGFGDVHVIDMDTIEISNLNRQFLFREKDIGQPKAVVAAEFINKRVKTCHVTPHYCRIQDKDSNFYQSFNVVISGLDSVVARRWINGMLASLLCYNDDGVLDTSSIIPLIDGGTEGFKGNSRIILLGLTPCIECILNLYPPQINYPMCTIAHTPRLPEHCVEYVRVLLWPKEQPFGGLSYRLTQGVVKHIIPAVASTNAIIASSCALEAFKLVTNCALLINNYLNFQDAEQIFAGVVELGKREDCPVCSGKIIKLTFNENATLKNLIDYLVKEPNFQMKNPAISGFTPEFNTLYVGNIPSIEEKTRPNLKKSLKELNLKDGTEIYVADVTTPNTVKYKLHLMSEMDT